MSSVRLYKRQIERFSHGNGAKVIACALRRYRDGELVIGSGSHDKDPGDILQLFPVWKKPDVPDALLRQILDAHFDTPRLELDREIQRLDRVIGEMFRQLPEYIVEEIES